MAARWHLSILLMVVYLGLFHLWMAVGPGWRILSTSVATFALIAIMVRAARRKYFVNRWDHVFHAGVLLDIGLEGFFVSVHDGFGFYFCALGFSTVIVSYRAVILRKQACAVYP